MANDGFVTQATYIVGLGGTGIRVLRRLKEKYEAKFEQLPKTIGLLGIDTDKQHDNLPGTALDAGEFVHAADFDAGRVLQQIDRFPRVRDWWKYPQGEINPAYVTSGAGALRPVGRLAYFHHLEGLIEPRLKDLISGPLKYQNRIEYPQQLSKFAVAYVIGSLAGGTGTGMFIDAGFTLRHLFSQTRSSDFFLNSIMVLPSVFEPVVDAQTRLRHQANGYAALMELDYFQTKGGAARARNIDYGPLKVPTSKLYDWVYLVGRRGAQGVLFDDPEQIYDRIAEFIFASIAMRVGQAGASTLDNWRNANDPNTRRFRGVHPIYSTFGVEVIETPSALNDAIRLTIIRQGAKRLGEAPADEEIGAWLERRLARHDNARRLIAALQSEDARADLFPELGTLNLPVPEPREAAGVLQAEHARLSAAVAGSGVRTSLFQHASEDFSALVNDVVVETVRESRSSLAVARARVEVLRRMLEQALNASPGTLEEAIGTVLDRLEKARPGLFGGRQKFERAWDDSVAWLRADADLRVHRRLKDLGRGALSQALSIADVWVEKLQYAEQQLSLAAKSMAAECERRIARPAATAQQQAFDLDQASAIIAERADVLGERFAGHVRRGAEDRVIELVEQRADPGLWQELIRSATDALVLEARRELFPRDARRKEIGERILKAFDLAQPLGFHDWFESDERMKKVGIVPAIWFVGSDRKGEDIGLDELLRDRRIDQTAGKPQTIDNQDPDRDEVFIARHGLFLDTMKEVQEARPVYEGLTTRQKLVRHVFPHLEEVREHRFEPADETSVRLYFAAAALTGAIRPEGASLVFSQAVFGTEMPHAVDGADWKERYERAEREFESGACVDTMRRWLQTACVAEGDNMRFKSKMKETAQRELAARQGDSLGEQLREFVPLLDQLLAKF